MAPAGPGAELTTRSAGAPSGAVAGAIDGCAWLGKCASRDAVPTPEFQRLAAGGLSGLGHQFLIEFVHGEQVNLSAYEREVFSPFAGPRVPALGFQEPVEAEEAVQVFTGADHGVAATAEAAQEIRAALVRGTA